MSMMLAPATTHTLSSNRVTFLPSSRKHSQWARSPNLFDLVYFLLGIRSRARRRNCRWLPMLDRRDVGARRRAAPNVEHEGCVRLTEPPRHPALHREFR